RASVAMHERDAPVRLSGTAFLDWSALWRSRELEENSQVEMARGDLHVVCGSSEFRRGHLLEGSGRLRNRRRRNAARLRDGIRWPRGLQPLVVSLRPSPPWRYRLGGRDLELEPDSFLPGFRHT